ncbi:Mov34/MPN/PAD-1 family protein [Chelativorans sp. SCAU2101]|uniref:Mov34/MPN/PAD-1 family protein n=1 Tax=Chelativorans petroleitrophicus TaxID=2975484 RepID=A0A9X3AZD8_9HYPH|nr:Mov34/MPN/PAD-1 family protein [Chelativorans petroleitrophicus]MCT8989599.1 Mov34/MPN/PAD-1 family protein [Chelativorans petroleitrophicus]
MQVSLPFEVRNRIKALLRTAGRREIGGILMGEQLEPGRFRIVDFSVDTISGTAAHFVRSPEHHGEALQAFFERTGYAFGRFNYLGEWHSHPCFPARPSQEDVQSMEELVHGERDIHFALLLIVRLRWMVCLDYSATVFIRHGNPQPVAVSS